MKVNTLLNKISELSNDEEKLQLIHQEFNFIIEELSQVVCYQLIDIVNSFNSDKNMIAAIELLFRNIVRLSMEPCFIDIINLTNLFNDESKLKAIKLLLPKLYPPISACHLSNIECLFSSDSTKKELRKIVTELLVTSSQTGNQTVYPNNNVVFTGPIKTKNLKIIDTTKNKPTTKVPKVFFTNVPGFSGIYASGASIEADKLTHYSCGDDSTTNLSNATITLPAATNNKFFDSNDNKGKEIKQTTSHKKQESFNGKSIHIGDNSGQFLIQSDETSSIKIKQYTIQNGNNKGNLDFCSGKIGCE